MSENDTDNRPILCFVDQNTSASNKDSEIYQRVAGKTDVEMGLQPTVIRTFRTQVSNLSNVCKHLGKFVRFPRALVLHVAQHVRYLVAGISFSGSVQSCYATTTDKK